MRICFIDNFFVNCVRKELICVRDLVRYDKVNMYVLSRGISFRGNVENG